MLFIALFKQEWVVLFLEWMEKIIHSLGNWNYVIGFVSATVESFPAIGVLVPGQQIMLMVGGFFGKWHLPEMVLCAAIGAILGNALGYFLGKRYGKAFLHRYGDWFGLGRTELRYLEKQIVKNGVWFIIFGKFHNFTRAFVPFIAGSMNMHTGKFWIANIAGSVLWASTIIVLGVAFAQFYKSLLEYFPYVLGGIVLIVTVYVYFFRREAFKEYLREKEREIEEKIQETEDRKRQSKK